MLELLLDHTQWSWNNDSTYQQHHRRRTGHSKNCVLANHERQETNRSIKDYPLKQVEQYVYLDTCWGCSSQVCMMSLQNVSIFQPGIIMVCPRRKLSPMTQNILLFGFLQPTASSWRWTEIAMTWSLCACPTAVLFMAFQRTHSIRNNPFRLRRIRKETVLRFTVVAWSLFCVFLSINNHGE